mmetsp:Transcript_82463/g.228781  ORF Transcript_82463/g.228781 Transcript_82463/m.228781 type:complete len:233 (-) Transcript_82463:562-1260(-)
MGGLLVPSRRRRIWGAIRGTRCALQVVAQEAVAARRALGRRRAALRQHRALQLPGIQPAVPLAGPHTAGPLVGEHHPLCRRQAGGRSTHSHGLVQSAGTEIAVEEVGPRRTHLLVDGCRPDLRIRELLGFLAVFAAHVLQVFHEELEPFVGHLVHVLGVGQDLLQHELVLDRPSPTGEQGHQVVHEELHPLLREVLVLHHLLQMPLGGVQLLLLRQVSELVLVVHEHGHPRQ